MPDLRQTRKQLKLAIGILAGVDVLALLIYFSPLVGSAESRRMQLSQLQAELTSKTRLVAPLQDLPHKVETANRQISDFYKNRLPAQSSQIATEFGKLAAANGVTIEQGKYKFRRTNSQAISNRWRWNMISRGITRRWRSSLMRWSATKCSSSSRV